MALSQKHSGKMLVPWFNTNEWKQVKNLIYDPASTDETKKTALKILNIWKLRSPKLPSGVEGTLIILDALLHPKEALPQDTLRILYGTAIMRFLNLCGASGDKQGTFYKMAKQNDIPDWLIDLRHDIAHDPIVPSKYMLELGLQYCFDWLKSYYWDVQEATLRDVYFSAEKNDNAEIILKLYCQFNTIQHLYKDGNLKGTDVDLEIIREKFETIENIVQVDLNENLEVILKGLLDAFCVYVINQQVDKQVIGKYLIEDSAMFDTELYGDADEPTLQNEFVMIWEDILNLLFKNKILMLVVKALVSVVDDEHSINRKIAGLWLIEIFKGLMLAKYVCLKYNDLQDDNHTVVDRKTAKIVIKEMVQKENTELKGALNFDTDNYKNIIENERFIMSEIMENPNVYTLGLLKRFKQNCKKTEVPSIKTTNAVEKLLQTQCLEENADDDRPYTVENLKSPKKEIVFRNVLGENVPQLLDIQNEEPRSRWRIVKDTSIFEGCPLGVLRHQDRNVNPHLSFE